MPTIKLTEKQVHRVRDFLNQTEIQLRSLSQRHPDSPMYKRDADELVELIALFYKKDSKTAAKRGDR